jgi:hypothetical protein
MKARAECGFEPDLADVANQFNSRCRPTANSATSTSARPIDFHKMERIGGDRICERAFTAAVSMVAGLERNFRARGGEAEG